MIEFYINELLSEGYAIQPWVDPCPITRETALADMATQATSNHGGSCVSMATGRRTASAVEMSPSHQQQPAAAGTGDVLTPTLNSPHHSRCRSSSSLQLGATAASMQHRVEPDPGE